MCKNCYDDGEHEAVGMYVCIYCGECKQLLLQTKYHNGKPVKGLHKYQATSPEPCDACKKKFEEENVVPIVEANPGPKGEPVFGRRYFMVSREAIHGEEFERMIEHVGFLLMPSKDIDEIYATLEARGKVKH